MHIVNYRLFAVSCAKTAEAIKNPDAVWDGEWVGPGHMYYMGVHSEP